MFYLPFSFGDIEQVLVGVIVVSTTAIAGYKFLKFELKELRRKHRHKVPKKELSPPG